MSGIAGKPLPRYSTSLVARVRELCDAGWGARDIQRLLESEGNGAPTLTTLKRWCDPRYLERHNQRMLRGRAKANAAAATFMLGRRAPTPEYKLAFACRLRAEGITVASVAKVMRVVFADAPSEDVLRRQLEAAS